MMRSRMISSGLVELVLVVVGGQPADDDAVVFSEALAVDFDVAGDRAAEGLVDREVAQELVGGGAVELRVVDELLPQLRVGAQVQQGERGLGGGGVDAAADEVPEDVEQLFVGEALAVEFELDEEAGQVVFRAWLVGWPRTRGRLASWRGLWRWRWRIRRCLAGRP